MKILGLHIIRHKKLQQALTAMYRAGLHKNKELLDNAIAENAQLVAELLKLEAAIAHADLVLTCEGRLDAQTAFGKAPAEVARIAKQHGVPCIAIAGSLDESAHQLHEVGFDAMFSLCPGPLSLQQAMENADALLARTTEQVIRSTLLQQSHRTRS